MPIIEKVHWRRKKNQKRKCWTRKGYYAKMPKRGQARIGMRNMGAMRSVRRAHQLMNIYRRHYH